MNLDVHFIGTGGSVPQARRGSPATAIHYGSEWLLFDCGEGTQRQLLQSVGLKNFDQIFITHMHTDHWLGLPSMLLTWTLLGRTKSLDIFGPPALRSRVEALANLKPSFPVYWSQTDDYLGGVRNKGYRVGAFEVEHAKESRGFSFEEDERPGTFDPEAALADGFVASEFGRLKRRGDFTGPPKPGRKVVLTGDTRPHVKSVVEAARGADLLIHEGSFLLEDASLAERANHSTAWGAAQTAKAAGVKYLALNHILSRTSRKEADAEARPIHSKLMIPYDFDMMSIPYQ